MTAPDLNFEDLSDRCQGVVTMYHAIAAGAMLRHAGERTDDAKVLIAVTERYEQMIRDGMLTEDALVALYDEDAFAQTD